MNCDTVRELAPAFVLGALTRSEERAVRDHLATCGEPHPEFEAFGGVVQYLDETVELVEPPAKLKVRLLAAVAAEPQPRASVATAERKPVIVESPTNGSGGVPVAARPVMAPPPQPRPAEAAPAPAPTPAPVIAPRPRRASLWRWLLAIAGVLAIVGLAAWSVLLQSQLDAARSYDHALASVLDLAARPGSQTAILSGQGGQPPRGIAVIADGSVVLAMRDLQPTVGSEVYELWSLPPRGGPTALGSFRVGSDGTATLTADLPPASGPALAISHEPGPDAGQPTTVVAQGVASAPR